MPWCAIRQNHWTMKVNYNYLRFKGLTHIVKEVCSYANWVLRHKAKSLNREIRSHWPISISGSKVSWYLLIMWKKYDHIPIQCWDIKQNHWTMKLGHKYVWVKGLVILIHNQKEVWKNINWVSRYKAKSLNHEIRSQWPRNTLRSKVLSYSYISWKKYVHIPIECRDIKENHWTVKLGHIDLGLL